MHDLLCWNPCYLESVLKWKKIDHTRVGDLFLLHEHVSHALLIDINSVFSQNPKFEPVDRTGHTKSPYKIHVPRPWKTPTSQWTLDESLKQRVVHLSALGKQINVLWSGGIDSTTAVTAFLKHLPDLAQLRILYSPFSTYEHPDYVDFLKRFSQLELIDISGERYLHDQFDGIFVSGDSGDEMHASIDQSFFEQYGYDFLHTPWKDFFYKKFSNDQFIESCQQQFSMSNRPIETVLEARWWFYASCKQRSILNLKLPWFFNYKKFDCNDLIGFFDCEEYENHVYWNINSVIDRAGYQTWKQPLKDYCCSFDNQQQWKVDKTKTHSSQFTSYLHKKLALNDQRWVALLADGTRIFTPSLPVFSRLEFEHSYKDMLHGLFNEPDKF